VGTEMPLLPPISATLVQPAGWALRHGRHQTDADRRRQNGEIHIKSSNTRSKGKHIEAGAVNERK